jgi:hypothetical protein
MCRRKKRRGTARARRRLFPALEILMPLLKMKLSSK